MTYFPMTAKFLGALDEEIRILGTDASLHILLIKKEDEK